MNSGIKRDEASSILKKLKECRVQLQKDNIYSCLMMFRDVLEKRMTTRMLPTDEKQLRKEINTFQDDLAASRAFKSIYGPVTFKDDDVETALDFMKQLIQIREEEIMEAMERQKVEGIESIQETLQQRMDKIMVLVEREDIDAARAMAEKDEEAADALIEFYNISGMEHRKEHDFEVAQKMFKKALILSPMDEGLYYNLSRVHIDMENWVIAGSTIQEALKFNPHFQEGLQLQSFIGRNLH